MEIKKVLLSSIKPNPKNYRIHSETQIQELVRSIRSFGQIRPIVVDDDMNILAGHGIYEAFKSAGVSEVYIYQVSLNEKDKIKLMLADNKTYELGSSDYDKIKELIKEIDDFHVPGYDEDALRLLIDRNYVDNSLSAFGKITDEQVDNMDKKKDEQEDKFCPCCGRKL